MASSVRKEFDAAFRSALDAGESTFEFQGKKYNTKMAPPKTESNRGGARRKSGTDIMDTLPKVGKVKTSELSPLEGSDLPRKGIDFISGNEDTPKQKIGFKAEDMGMGQYSMPKGSSFIPGETDKPMSSLPGRSPNKEQYRKAQEDYQSDLVGKMAMKKGGMVKAKRSSKRGCGIATKGFGRAGGR